ncbi:MAG: beta-glucosidase [Thermogemmatispora sp.]|jgi:beta-glucosidase|uniref:GH1 family beta-glucosidase n=1 Tax=Thermogemmatispora TaxID=768669 RepID=UPI00124DCB81|nr:MULTISPECIES: GH1 family beta-glucosidase [Thermogemmatispora]MBE3567938.1 beta-glucosidase [Thermogemmatispora sp.]GER85507.1 beta-glucosidase [Thermogemmatispora aurantia]
MTSIPTVSFQAVEDLAARFPAGFFWGAATSSYQVEGAVAEDGRGPSIWDDFSATPGKVVDGQSGAQAADHYHRYREDVALMARLGLNAYRFSIAWPRVLPEGRGLVNQAGLDFYDRLVDALLEAGIQPFVTLYHWDLPSALEREGGWRVRSTAYAFADYAEVVARRLGDRVLHWMTLNEPWCSAYLGYGIGVHAPGLRDRQAAVDAAHHLLLAHGLALPRMRAVLPAQAQIGTAQVLVKVYGADERPETQRDVALAHAFSNRWFLDPLYRGCYPEGLFAALGLNPPPIEEGDLELMAAPLDFLGVNNYSRMLVRGSPEPPLADQCRTVSPVPNACYTDMAWEIFPQGLRDLLLDVSREYPVQRLYVTENGAAFPDEWDGGETVHDPRRVAYLASYISACAEALEQGAPLCGYFVWSLLDNFEWAEGYRKRFGIVYVDYASQRRVMKESAHWYAALLQTFQARSRCC